MMKNDLKNLKYAILLILGIIAGQVSAQIPIRTGPASAAEIKKARALVDANPYSISACKAYLYALGISSPEVATQYQALMKKYPDNVVIPLAFGTCYYNAELPQAKEYLLKVVAMEPGNAKAWQMLSDDAINRGEKELSARYIKTATLIDPSNADYATGYMMSFMNSEEYKQKVFDFIKRFPENDHGAGGLYWLAVLDTSISEKISYFEQLRKLYPPQKFSWSAEGMRVLADIYLQNDPTKALALINSMQEDEDLKLRKQAAESLIKIDKLEQEKNYKDALFEIDKVKLPVNNWTNDYVIIEKAALLNKAGNPKAAYDTLAAKFAKQPTDQVYTLLKFYGQKSGFEEVQITKNIKELRYIKAAPAYPFTLGLYNSADSLSLNKLKGKVVLLTFWFPACVPCREEFPHFQAVINEFKGDSVEYIGINVTPMQDAYVLQFLKNNKISFIPLRGSSAFAFKNYGVSGEPENFLIDKDGKIVFKNFRINETNHRTLELMITSLLSNNN